MQPITAARLSEGDTRHTLDLDVPEPLAASFEDRWA
jgi:hypothetical protein